MESNEVVHPQTHVPLAELRARVDEKLAADEAKVEFLDSTLTSISKIVTQMAFGTRIQSMEDNIRPVDEETSALISQKKDVDKVRQLLEDVAEFYGLAGRVKPLIDQGPANRLDEYLKVLVRVDEAMAYFENNNPENRQLGALGNLRRTGHLKLEEHFHQLLVKNSTPPQPQDVIHKIEAMPHLDRDDDRAMDNTLEGCKLYAPWGNDVTNIMQRILHWLHEADAEAQTLRNYVQARGTLLESVLTAAKKARPSKERAARGLSTSQQKKALERSHSFLRKGGKHDSHAAARARRASELPQAQAAADSGVSGVAYHPGEHPLISAIKAVLLAFWNERQLARTIIHHDDDLYSVMRGLMVPVMDRLKSEFDLVATSAETALEKGMFFSLVHIFDLLEHLEDLAPHVCQLLDEAGEEMPQRYNAIHLGLAEVARKVLFRFQDSINSDAFKKLPEDGTVHELTSRTLKFVLELVDFVEAAGTVLRTDLGSVRTGVSWLEADSAAQLLADWLHSVVTALQGNLGRKAKGYEQPAVASVFLLNNYDYILRTLHSERLADVLRYLPQEIPNFEALLDQTMQHYRDETWRAVMPHLHVEPVSGVLSKKTREGIKEQYTGFNEGLEAAVKLQRDLSVPNKELSERLRRLSIELIVPAFERFDNSYRFSGFSQKNPQKYLKYMASDVEAAIKTFFSGTGQ